ncbi:MAG: tetratricopeptide repeat protein [candidate division KSB1 bacterium]|nr:tetratricopeptide repeat protein [candidate division KSB1 bacterium]MDZ7365647.1 tetratricopeptide repeat protein [candidate division KSB1 bacterium]MDZ7403277.1 tetratricopeptide repeat protein [candidate division KSB1 bacterium]
MKRQGYFKKKFSTLAAAVAALLILQGCGGYYNTFYNTKKIYKEAAEERKRRTGTADRPGAGEIQKYDKAIEKASKLLQLHPKSRYVDDALLLIGECFFYKQEYLKAQRKFQELITLYPKSGLAPRAQLWLAKTNIELNDYAGAEKTLKELEAREKKGEIVNQGRYLLGEIYFRRKEYIQAAKEYEAAGRKLGDAKIRSEAYMQLGKCFVELEQFDLAANAFRRAGSAIKNDINLKFEARLQYAMALKNHQKINQSLTTLNAMLKEFSTHRDLPRVKLEIAACNRMQGKIETAVKQYSAIIENHQHTEASAAAFFALGEIYENSGDFARAKENYDNVRRESSRFEKLAEAEQRSKAIASFIKLRETVAILERQLAALESGKGKAARRLADHENNGKKSSEERRPISRIPRRAKNATPEMTSGSLASKDPDKVAAELAKNKILLAELFLFNFNRPDSAMREYLDVFEFYPQTEYAPQAMYSLAYILGDAPATLAMRDSILQVLARNYGSTPQGLHAKHRLGLADTLALSPTLPSLLRQAEENLFKQKNPERAVRLYEEFLQRQPDSQYAAQTLYAVGWIYENELSDNKQALAAYKKLIETYPDSPMARRVRHKVMAVEQPAQSKPVAPPAVTPDAPAETEIQAEPEKEAGDEAPLPFRPNYRQMEQERRQQMEEKSRKPPKDQEKNKNDDDEKEADDEPPEPPGL